MHLAQSVPTTVKISKSEIKLISKFQIDLTASGFLYETNIMDGHADLNASIAIQLVDEEIQANLTIEKIKVDPGTTGLAGYMPVTFKKSMEQWLEHRVWPILSDAVRTAFKDVGIRSFGGINCSNMEVTQMDGAIIVDADVEVDLGALGFK